jgi:hypothetical protein
LGEKKENPAEKTHQACDFSGVGWGDILGLGEIKWKKAHGGQTGNPQGTP